MNFEMNDRSSSSKVRGKRTPRKNLKHVEKAGLESNTATEFCEVESRGSSDVSNPEPNAMSKVEDMNSGELSCLCNIYYLLPC